MHGDSQGLFRTLVFSFGFITIIVGCINVLVIYREYRENLNQMSFLDAEQDLLLMTRFTEASCVAAATQTSRPWMRAEEHYLGARRGGVRGLGDEGAPQQGRCEGFREDFQHAGEHAAHRELDPSDWVQPLPPHHSSAVCGRRHTRNWPEDRYYEKALVIEFFEFIIAVRHVVPMSLYVICEKFQLVLGAWVNRS